MELPLKQGFFVHHEAHEGHEEQTIGLKKAPSFNDFFFLRALRVLRGDILDLD
jgi:hypothetical protein